MLQDQLWRIRRGPLLYKWSRPHWLKVYTINTINAGFRRVSTWMWISYEPSCVPSPPLNSALYHFMCVCDSLWLWLTIKGQHFFKAHWKMTLSVTCELHKQNAAVTAAFKCNGLSIMLIFFWDLIDMFLTQDVKKKISETESKVQKHISEFSFNI